MFFMTRSLELQALPYALNRPPRAAASFNKDNGPDGAAGIEKPAESIISNDEQQHCARQGGVPLRWRSHPHKSQPARIATGEECTGLISLALAAYSLANENASDKPVDF
jgi:hypothetical protein